ncbi:MAG: hypothetical protein A2147_02685 [Chloroflexi bacterium RBG_16_57_8]|nr:MAG: hypothetical protein A2147_02685 [Chloroflexi bacterium RBG_16_57_8]
MFPCYATSLVSGGEGNEGALYLDQAPDLGVAASEITLIGCEVSNRIFTSVYGVKPAEFIDMCPKNMIRGTSQPCLSRCCMIDEGHRIEGSAAYVSWGASVGEVEEAIIDLFRLDVEEAPSLDEFDALGNRVANLTS